MAHLPPLSVKLVGLAFGGFSLGVRRGVRRRGAATPGGRRRAGELLHA